MSPPSHRPKAAPVKVVQGKCKGDDAQLDLKDRIDTSTEKRLNIIRRAEFLGCDATFTDLLRRLKRDKIDNRLAWEWVAALRPYELNTYVTLTWSDEAAEKYHVAGAASAMRDFKAFMRSMGVREYFAAVEGHQNRTVPHVHAVVQFRGIRKDMWQKWWDSRQSMAKILPVQDGCLSYVTKYIMKDRGDTGGFTTEWELPNVPYGLKEH